MARAYPPAVVEQVRAQMAEGISQRVIAAELGLRYYEIGNICLLHSIPRPGRGSTPVNPESVRAAAAKGLSSAEIAEEMGFAVETIRRICRKHKITLIKRSAMAKSDALPARPRVSARPAPQTSSSAESCNMLPYGLGPSDRDALVGTGGRYRDLQLWADARGLTLVQAQQRWHALGLAVVKGVQE